MVNPPLIRDVTGRTTSPARAVRAVRAVAVAGSAAIVAIAAAPASLVAQHVRVVLTASGTATPVPGAIVSLERDGSDVRIAPVLSDDAGRALLGAPASGSYRVRVDRVGAQTWRSPLLALTRPDTLDYRATVDLTRTMLGAVVIEGTSSCRPQDGGDDVMAAWEEARKGVLMASLNGGQGAPALDVQRFERLISPSGRVESESVDSVFAATTRPFTTVRSAAELSRLGYVVKEASGEAFLAPDFDVLLSEEFVGDHCLSLVRDRRAPGLIGIAFQPVPERTLPDIQGTFWLDGESGEPRTLTFDYVNVDDFSLQSRAGGMLAFQRLPTGNWIVNEWSVRTPRRGIFRNFMGGGHVVERDTVLGTREEGARVLAVSERPVLAAGAHGAPVELAGTFFDSLAGAPLAGVRLRLLGTGISGVTDSLGKYSLSVTVRGDYTLAVQHPRLSLFRVPANQKVSVGDGAANRFDLAIPRLPQLRGSLCPLPTSGSAPSQAAVLVGRVLADDGRPVANAALRLAWTRQVMEGSVTTLAYHSEPVSEDGAADGDGYFVFCHLPPDSPLSLTAEAPDRATRKVTVRLRSGSVGEQLLRLDSCVPARRAPGCAEPR